MSPLAVDKGAVARNFSAAASTYDGWASAQAEIASALVSRIPARFSPSLVADLGCGTGMLSVRLLARYPGAFLVGVDLAEGMVGHCRDRRIGGPRARFLQGDVELASALPPGADLIASSCAVQWLSDLPGTLRMWASALPPGGVLALAALVRGSFPELEAAHAEAFGTPFPGLDFPAPERLTAPIRSAGLRVRAFETLAAASTHPGAREAIRSFRKVGARLPGRPPMGPIDMRRLLDALDRRRNDAGDVTLTHRAALVVAEREG